MGNFWVTYPPTSVTSHYILSFNAVLPNALSCLQWRDLCVIRWGLQGTCCADDHYHWQGHRFRRFWRAFSDQIIIPGACDRLIDAFTTVYLGGTKWASPIGSPSRSCSATTHPMSSLSIPAQIRPSFEAIAHVVLYCGKQALGGATCESHEGRTRHLLDRKARGSN